MAITHDKTFYIKNMLDVLFTNWPHIRTFVLMSRFSDPDISDATWIDYKDEIHRLPIDLTQSPEEIATLVRITLRMMYGNSFEGQEGSSS